MNQPIYALGNVRDDPDWDRDDDWEIFSKFWESLSLDTHMGDGGTYRRRRYSTVLLDGEGGVAQRIDHDGFLQSREINRLNGGVIRRFDPIDPALLDTAVVRQLLAHFTARIENSAHGDRPQHPNRSQAPIRRVNIHQHRITATRTSSGNPTPEGVHRDGVEHIVMMLVARKDISGGSSTLHDNDGKPLLTHTLTSPGDYIFLEDRTCMHSASPVTAAPSAAEGHRDMFFLEFC
ncbi:2OG-Fe dioxygenase family protein [Streptomyces sp. NBC_01411]|uniref:2OG-Fe dioxygenase family protein n=1 Tax=Streptomyces sp. NBC_01411 TaxID=2903857 RepID=UPI003252FC3A